MNPAHYCEELPYKKDAAEYFMALSDLPYAAWLDSSGMARFDILTAAPYKVMDQESSYAELRRELGSSLPPLDDLPFAGGALGCFSYDGPRMLVAIYDWALVLDHFKKTARLVSRRRLEETGALLKQVLRRLQTGIVQPRKKFRVHGNISCNFTKQGYDKAFAKVQEYLQSGDCYQVNLAQRFFASAEGDPLTAYLELRKMSPAPYSAYLDFPEIKILCASPERFISVGNGKVVTRPIKGTRPRSLDPLQDARFAEELRCHPKDRAENLMIVDLLRNDLGKCCKTGSVKVPELFKVESYSNVHHLVSTVEGELEEGCDALDMLGACFPGGSVTGAPKLRAIEIISELEPDARGIYCGAIGYMGFDGNMDSNIAIRTLVYDGREICCYAGGGIVADSRCDEEYQETLDKASAMLKLLRLFSVE
jgi:para-aminobenzoate synthetase component 1